MSGSVSWFQMPDGFLGTRANLVFDLIIIVEIVVIGVLLYSIGQARMKRYGRHKAIMLTTLLAVALVLVLFEVNLRASGGAGAVFRQSRFAGTRALTTAIYVHLLFAISTVAAWVTLVITSLVKHPTSLPGSFSPAHRPWGKVVLCGFLLVTASALVVYVLGFVF
jgi:putative membrane protein